MQVEQIILDSGKRVSWGSIVAGVFTAVAVSLVMAILGIAFGFTVIEPTSNDPFSGLGMTFGIWSVLSVIVSLAAGGFIAGFFAAGKGPEHGFLVWAVVLLLASIFSSMAVGSAMNMVGSAARAVGSGAAQVASGVGGGVKELVSNAVEAVHDNVDLQMDMRNMRAQVRRTLRDTGIETLQPEYLSRQMREARSDFRRALHQLRLNRDNYNEIITAFLDKQQDRLDAIVADVDREDAVRALMRNTDMTRAEAEEAVDDALYAFQNVTQGAQDALAEARQQLEDAREYMAELADRARIQAEEVADAAAKAAFMAAIALILGAIVASLAGAFGVRYAIRRYNL